MAHIMNVRCNGPGKHVNAVDLDKLLERDIVFRRGGGSIASDVPARLVYPCRQCTDGKVVITREMVEDYRRRGIGVHP